MIRRLLLITFSLTSVLLTSLRAEEVQDINLVRSRFFIDHAVFADTLNNRLEVYYKVFNDGLNYVKKGDKFVANYEVNVIIYGDKDKQVTGKSVEKTYTVDSYEGTHSESSYLINQITLPLAPGNYGLVCKLIDHNSNDASTIETKVKSYSFNRGADISDIEFIQEQADIGEPTQFMKGGRPVLPMVERSLDGELQKLGFYVEVYAGDLIGRSVNLKYRIESKREGIKIEDSIPLTCSEPLVRVYQYVPINELAPAEYDLSLKLMSDSKSPAERSARFLVRWSLASLIKNDFEYAVDQLRYITKKEEKKALEAAPDSLKQQAFEDFWKHRDPTPNTPENELREEYYRRIRYANQYYSTVNREGWETDRGMVYIRYGEPDQIERHPFELDSKPFQIWYYFTLRRTFQFVDTRGDGDYQLQFPYDGDMRRGAGQ